MAGCLRRRYCKRMAARMRPILPEPVPTSAAGIGGCPTDEFAIGVITLGPDCALPGSARDSPSGLINITKPPYSVVPAASPTDTATDNTAMIQGATDDACAVGGAFKPEVFLPATPGGSCYRTSSPIQLHCDKQFNGGGWKQTKFCQTYYGPNLIVQGAETGWKPPLTASITAVCKNSHFYGQYREILDSNGNVEVATTGGTSGSGWHPAWPGTNGGTVSDGSVIWTRAMTGTTLATGSGSTLDGVSNNSWPGARFRNNHAAIEIANASNLEARLTGFPHFTVEFYTEAMAPTNSSNTFGLLTYGNSAPQSSNVSAMSLTLTDGMGSCTHNYLAASFDIGGSNVSIPVLDADHK